MAHAVAGQWQATTGVAASYNPLLGPRARSQSSQASATDAGASAHWPGSAPSSRVTPGASRR
eukprot:8634295-Pyramimonas_sp.AAC.1